MAQLSEIQMVDYNGNFLSFGSIAQVENAAPPHTYESEQPEYAFDGDTATKWLSGQGDLDSTGTNNDGTSYYVASFVILNFTFVSAMGSATETSVAAYDFTTANDYSARDPVSWTIYCYDPTADSGAASIP